MMKTETAKVTWHRIGFQRLTPAGRSEDGASLSILLNNRSLEKAKFRIGSDHEQSFDLAFAEPDEQLFWDARQAVRTIAIELKGIMAALSVSDIPLIYRYRSAGNWYSHLHLSCDAGNFAPGVDFDYQGLREITALLVAAAMLLQTRISIATALGLDESASAKDILEMIESRLSAGLDINDAEAGTISARGAFGGSAALREATIRKIRTQQLSVKILRCAPVTVFGYNSFDEDEDDCQSRLGIPKTLIRALIVLKRKATDLDESLPPEFLFAIRAGANLSRVWTKLVANLLLDNKEGLMGTLSHLKDRSRRPRQAALESVAELFKKQCVRPDLWNKCANSLKKFDDNYGPMSCAQEIAGLMAALPHIAMTEIPAEVVEQIFLAITRRLAYHRRQQIGCFSEDIGADIYYSGIYEMIAKNLLELLRKAPAAA